MCANEKKRQIYCESPVIHGSARKILKSKMLEILNMRAEWINKKIIK